MIDTIKIILPESAELNTNGLTFVSEYVSAFDGLVVKRYSYKNILITIGGRKPKIEGSLTKLICGDNLGSIATKEAEKGINELSEVLGYDISEGIIYRIDYGINVELDKPTAEYIERCGNLPKFKKHSVDSETLLYDTSNVKLSLYDKLSEFVASERKHGKKRWEIEIPKKYKDKHLLRIEVRLFAAKIKKLFEKLQVKDLLTNRTINILQQQLRNYFSLINKNKEIIMNFEGLNNKEIGDFLKLQGFLSLLGNDILKVFSYLERQYKTNLMTKNQYFFQKKHIKKVIESPKFRNFISNDKLIDELQTKFYKQIKG